MSRENVDFVRRIFDTFPVNQHRLRAGTLRIGPPLSKDIEWDASEVRFPYRKPEDALAAAGLSS